MSGMRSFVAGLALLLAGLVGTVALGAYVAHRTVLDPDRAGQVLASALGQPELRQMLLAKTVPGYQSLPQGYQDDLDRLVANPQLDHALRMLRVDSSGNVDVAPVRRELARKLRANGQPQLASQVAARDGQDTVRLPARISNRYASARDKTWLVATGGAAVSGVLFLAALVVSRNRRATLRAIGFTVLAVCGVIALLYWLLPVVAQSVSSNGWVDAATAVTRSQVPTMVATVVPVAAVGLALFVGSFFIPRPRRVRAPQ